MTTPDSTNQQPALSNAMLLGIAALGGGTLLAVAGFSGFNKGQILILLAAILLVLVILLIFRLVLKWLTARRSAPFTQTVQRAAGDTPNAISSPGSRAKLDDLRRNFDAGVSRFRAAGKDLYKLPWYLLVGEPGSGKTEAIRHSSIPFPPGLQDQLQGSGGTVNMNWWFTNDAVILDTAGRYMFNEVQAGASTEWTEFLRLLVRNRPQCPINGLLLVIPANSLILDTADQIEAKGGQIAQQLDRIQRTLEVRFPVYIVVTKCDLVNGFREFFDGLNDPRLQHQILGWSNPAPLDQSFNPELVDEHLKSVAAKLSQRRMGLLLDPVARESEQSRRIDEVDSLYSLPESFLRLGPRLRRYLEMIFVAGEWSPKPLFLRGIYFTSSMREGQAIDAELMELLHVPPESLREGKLWERDRAFFLRDLFLKKVFPEKGLVTRAASTAKLQRTRMVALLGGGFVAVALLVFFTWFGARKVSRSIGEQHDFWNGLAKLNDPNQPASLDIVEPARPSGAGSPATVPTYRSRLDDPVPGAGLRQSETVGDLYAELLDYGKQKKIYVDPVFFPAAKVLDGVNLNDLKEDDYAKLFKNNVMVPLVSDAGQKLAAENADTWSPAATAALAELVRCQSGKAITLDPLFQYLVPDAAASDRFRSRYASTLGKGFELVQPDGKAVVSPPDGAISSGVDHFIEHWNNRVAQSALPFQSLVDASGPAESASNALKKMAGLCQGACKSPPDTTVRYSEMVNEWRAAFAEYKDACKDLSDRVGKLALDDPSATLAEQYKSRFGKAANEAKVKYEALLAQFPVNSSGSSADAASRRLYEERDKLERARGSLTKLVDDPLSAKLDELDKSLLKTGRLANGTPIRSYECVQRIYKSADDALPAAQSLIAAAPAAGDADAQINTARTNVNALGGTVPNDSSDAAKNANILLSSVAEPAAGFLKVKLALNNAPKSPEDVRNGVEALAALDPVQYPQISFPKTPFMDWPEAVAGYNPTAAATYLQGLAPLLKQPETQTQPPAGQGNCAAVTVLNRSQLESAQRGCNVAISGYLDQYAAFWTRVADTHPNFRLKQNGNEQAMDWDALQRNRPIRAKSVNDDFDQVASLLLKAAELPDTIKQNGDSGGLGQLKRTAQAAKDALKADLFSDAFDHWVNLGSDAVQAKDQVLDSAAGEFAAKFMLVEVKDDNLVSHYWHSLLSAMLDALTKVEDPAIGASLKWLSSHHGFPLGNGDSPPMPPKDLDELREMLKNLKLSDASAGGGANRTIRSGDRLPGREEYKQLNALLDKLANGSIHADQRNRIKLLIKFLEALPSTTDPATCNISIPDFKTQQDLQEKYAPDRGLAAKEHWSSGVLQLEKKKNEQFSAEDRQIRLTLAGNLGDASCPGEPIRFALYDIPDDKKANHQYLSPPSGLDHGPAEPWDCLRLLTGNAHPSGQPNAFYVELTPTFQGHSYSIWLLLKFTGLGSGTLPEYKDWPR